MTTILFVHFGKKLPYFLTLNIARTSELFPLSEIVLVTNSDHIPKLISKKLKVLHPDSLNWKSNRIEIHRDQRFWGGWWQKTFDRLLMISPVHQMYPEGGLLHVESDTIIFPSFPFSFLEKNAKISYPMYSSFQSVASVVFSPSVEKSKQLEEQILHELSHNPKTSDMDALGVIAPRLEKDYMELLEFPREENPTDPLIDGIGVFDGLSHGEWLCGRDPKANWGVGMRLRRTPNSESKFFPIYEYSGHQMYLYFKGRQVKLNNLHVHSKEKYFFQLKEDSQIQFAVKKVNQTKQGHLYFFSLPGFLFCLWSNIKIWSSSLFSKDAWLRLLRQ